MEKEQKFVQLGLRKNGRIVKNQQYEIEKLCNSLFDRIGLKMNEPIVELTFWNRIRKDKCSNIISAISRKRYNEGFNSAVSDMIEHFKNLIDQDNFGKKKK